MASINQITIPSAYAALDTNFSGPSQESQMGKWTMVWATLPMWKDKHNCSIEYAPLPPKADGTIQVSDIATYQTKASNKTNTIKAVNTPRATSSQWTWRGLGWQRIISVNWEIFGYGDLASWGQWMLVFFDKTWLTRPGMEILIQQDSHLKGESAEAAFATIIDAVKQLNCEQLNGLVRDIYPVSRDDM